jgi:argininosuccinate lyase
VGVPSQTPDPSGPGRLLEGPAAELVHSAYGLELRAAPVLLPELVLADLAHILALLDGGLVPPEAGRALIRALLELRDAVPPRVVGSRGAPCDDVGVPLDPARGDLVMNVEEWLRGRIGRAAGYLLVGRPRREAITVAFHLAVRYRVVSVAAALERLQRRLVQLASAHLGTLAVDYTYWQPAQPTTLAHALLAYAYPLGRDFERLEAAFGRVNASPEIGRAHV